MNALDRDVDARAIWDSLAGSDPRGEDYLASRQLWPDVLAGGDVVRYTAAGAPAVPLRHLAIGGAIVNVVRRTLPADVAQGRPKALGLRGCPTEGALIGDVDQIVAERRDAVVCEGVADSLAAVLCWPTAVICGAHGAGRLADVAWEVAARVAMAGARMFLVHDDDATGMKAAAKAVRAAMAAGLVVGETLVIVDLDGAHDLAAAWRDGWRP